MLLTSPVQDPVWLVWLVLTGEATGTQNHIFSWLSEQLTEETLRNRIGIIPGPGIDSTVSMSETDPYRKHWDTVHLCLELQKCNIA